MLASARNKKINHWIKFENMNKSKFESFWKLLYNMSYKKFLILQKTLIKYLNKNFIHVSNSFISMLVFFVKKLSRELCFCVNYHVLNKLTKKNYYFLFLINEILEWINKTRWFMKFNIIHVFHRIQIIKKNK